eukprot:CAMPEP_0204333486 /NCGR_PEP_ID=MMETSP0469-20131031/17259_1 /ASSEMBLY_ACC=CAM_ASM_000384 /TAXON_ID=2969 /ORGANISM="Oxyrrhis marina" /LENGTH=59 /DNA_ID=CAMNT_0051316829 /DNA_START=31 /DNA_END=207 /DNA_ORIENTATION=+
MELEACRTLLETATQGGAENSEAVEQAKEAPQEAGVVVVQVADAAANAPGDVHAQAALA